MRASVPALPARRRARMNTALKRKDRCELRAHVVRGVARDAAEQRQEPGAVRGARAVVALLVGEGRERVQPVLDVAGEEGAARAARAEAPCVARRRLVVAVVEVCSPARVASFRVGVEEAREREAELYEAALRAYGSLRRDDGHAVAQPEDDRRGAVNRSGACLIGQPCGVVEVREQLAGEEGAKVGAVV